MSIAAKDDHFIVVNDGGVAISSCWHFLSYAADILFFDCAGEGGLSAFDVGGSGYFTRRFTGFVCLLGLIE